MLYRTLLGGMGTGRSVMTESFFRSFDGTNRINGCQEATATRILVVQATAQIDLSNLTPQFMVE